VPSWLIAPLIFRRVFQPLKQPAKTILLKLAIEISLEPFNRLRLDSLAPTVRALSVAPPELRRSFDSQERKASSFMRTVS